ncbi:hypothetical protein [Shewanella salipaludis]|uniref:Uncharacterized protein n=1 Tax=Shewanella salipaludis TaxID=2723052 RepID=A0A972G1C2_9GAMM|nr:hypothetical protein [Shewanella salipaludis]NMH66497.1 hypothetical protein [Shewanella salipaludis]
MSMFLGKQNFKYSKFERIGYAVVAFLLLALLNYIFIDEISRFANEFLSVFLQPKEKDLSYGYFFSLMVCCLASLLSYHYPRFIHATLLIFPLVVISN